MPARWLLLYNCQAQGLGNCLNLLAEDVRVDHYEPVGLARQREKVAEALPGYDRVFVAPQLLDDPSTGLDLAALGDRVVRLPTIYFSGYHPDTCYIDDGAKRPLRGPLGEYHSVITYASFLQGLSEGQAVRRFREPVYARMRYFARWDGAWRRMVATFQQNGFDLRPLRVAWARRGPFMYTLNHPRIECLRDLAVLLLAREGRQARYLDALPADNLANGPVIPVFPGVATRVGCPGSLLFKRPGEYRHMTLEEFVSESYVCYRRATAHAIRPDYAELLERARQATPEAA